MKNFKPSLGNTARGDAFYPRKREIEKIFDFLESNTNIYLSAPRRVGKTSILKHLEDTDYENGYYFIYVITESAYSVNEFFKIIYNELIASKAIQSLAKLSKGLTDLLSAVVHNVEVKGIKTKEQAEPDYYELFVSLLDKIDNGIGRVVIMIDEFPQTLHNINKQHGEIEARRFIQVNRVLRHHKVTEAKISFIYTGSIALFPTVEKIGTLNDVNDIEIVEVKPLSVKDATELLRLLCDRKNVDIETEAVNYLLTTIKWLIPFHIQLIYVELEEIFHEHEATLMVADVDAAIARTVSAKNKARFEPYFSRLKGLLEHSEYQFAMDVLKYTAHHDMIDKAIYFDLSQKYEVGNYREILDGLCEDGYLYETGEKYMYTSPILQLWCKTNNNYGI
jgi:AAA+ ATPase superfamily predicted ATPase